MRNCSLKLEDIDNIVAKFCSEVIIEPLCFFSEGDLQGLLFTKLMKRFPGQIETSFLRGPGSKGRYKTGLVHREYGVGARHRMDIIIFSTHDASRIDSSNLQIKGKYIQPSYGIELGTEKTPNIERHLRRDILKLRKVKERGYLIFFFRDTTSADMGTKSRTKTEQKIRRVLRKPFESYEIPATVKVLCFLLRLVRRRKRIFGKCEVYNSKSNKWNKVNLRKAKDGILNLLV